MAEPGPGQLCAAATTLTCGVGRVGAVVVPSAPVRSIAHVRPIGGVHRSAFCARELLVLGGACD